MANRKPKNVYRKVEGLTALVALTREQGAKPENGWSWASELPSIDATRKLALEGYSEGAARIREQADKIQQAVCGRIVQAEPVFDVCGLEIEMGAYCEGRPECFLDVVETEAPARNGRVVRVIYNGTHSGMVSCASLEKKGAAVAALVACLESTGRSCEVVHRLALSTEIGHGPEADSLTVDTVVKGADSPLDIGALAFALSHPAMFRRLGFALIQGIGRDRERLRIKSNMGYPYDNQTGFDAYDVKVTTNVGALDEDAIVEILREQGVEVSPA